MILKCKDVIELISEFFDDELEAEEQEFLFNHIYQCKNCLNLYNSLHQMLDLVHSLKPIKLEQKKKREFHRWLHIEVKQIVIKKYKKL